jgi:hypothetical protein
MKKQIALLLLTFTFAFPAFAQEGTQAPESTQAPVVVDQAPVLVESNQDLAIVLVSVFGLVGMLWGIISSVLNHKSIPVSEVDKLLARALEMALSTKRTDDEKLVKGAMTVWQGAKDLGLVPVEAPATTTVTTTTTTTPIEDAVG